MSEVLKQLLGDLYTDAIAKAIGDKQVAIVNDGSWLPRTKYNEKDLEAKELKRQLDERDQQLQALEGKAQGHEELKAALEEAQKANREAAEQWEAKTAQMRLDFAIEKALTDAKAKNAKAVRALLNMEQVKLDGEQLLGLQEQLDALQKSDAYLFGKAANVGGDTNPPTSGNDEPNPWKPETRNLTKQGQLLRTDPAKAARLRAEAGIQ